MSAKVGPVHLYWYGFGEDIARRFTCAVTSTRPRLIEGFDRDISYKPITIVYPDGESSRQSLAWGLDGGYIQNYATLGMNVQVLTPSKVHEDAANCPYYPSSGEWTMDERLYLIPWVTRLSGGTAWRDCGDR